MTVPPPPGQTPPPPPPVPGQTPPPPPVPPAPGMPPMPPSGPTTPSNGLAVTSLVLGIISIVSACVGYFAGIPAIIFGVMGKKKAAQMNGIGSGQAVGGLVMGIIGTVAGVIFTILFFVGAFAADNAANDFSKSYEKARKEAEKSANEYEEQQSRKGDDAKKADFNITKAEVDVGTYGYITYSAYIENTSDFETGFKVKIRCEGDLGDVDTQPTYAYSLSPGDKENLQAYFSFDQDTSSVDCEATEVLYD